MQNGFSDRPEEEEVYEVAGMGKRFINWIIDTSLIYIIWSYIALSLYPTVESIQENSSNVTLLLVAILVPYYFVLESLTGKTVGKFITGSQVVTEDGEKPGVGKIAIRTLCRMIPFEAISFLIFRGIGWHDTFSSTRVIVPAGRNF